MKKLLFHLFTMTTKVIKTLIIVLIAIPIFSYSQPPTKVVDLSDDISHVDQAYDFWCVYACLEAGDNLNQCEYCLDYIGNYIRDYNDRGSNPYWHLLDDSVFYNTIVDYNNYVTSLCIDPIFSVKFGVLSMSIVHFIRNECYCIEFLSLIIDT